MQGDKLMQKSTDVIMQRRLLISINLSEMYETKKSSVFFWGVFFWFVCCFFFFLKSVLFPPVLFNRHAELNICE